MDTGARRKRRRTGGRSTGVMARSTAIRVLRRAATQQGVIVDIPRPLRTGGFTGKELKFHDEEFGNTFAITWGSLDPAGILTVSAVAIGSGESNRIGREYRIHSFHMKWHVSRVSAEGTTAPPIAIKYRFMIVLDKQTNLAQMASADVLQLTGITDPLLAWRNLQKTKRFRVLADINGVLNPNYMNEGSPNLFAEGQKFSKIRTFNRTFKTPLIVQCPGTTAVVGSISDLSIHIIGVASNTALTMNYSTRIRFTG